MREAAGVGLEDLGLFTDLYQLTMAQSYFEHRKNGLATFSKDLVDQRLEMLRKL